jgi:hypothetical protein
MMTIVSNGERPNQRKKRMTHPMPPMSEKETFERS